MTKPRAPLTFADAITRVAGVVTFPECARIVDRSERTVRLWSEPDAGGCCTLEQAKALDLAYVAAGGDGCPILESYACQVETEIVASLRDSAALLHEIGSNVVEHAEAIRASIAVARPNPSPTEVHRAIAETEEASGAVTRLLARLKTFLPGNRAGMEDRGSKP